MRKFRIWLSNKLMRLSYRLLPNSPLKTKFKKIEELIRAVTKNDEFKKLVKWSTETRTSPNGFVNRGRGGLEYLDDESDLEIQRYERSIALKKTVKIKE